MITYKFIWSSWRQKMIYNYSLLYLSIYIYLQYMVAVDNVESIQAHTGTSIAAVWLTHYDASKQ